MYQKEREVFFTEATTIVSLLSEVTTVAPQVMKLAWDLVVSNPLTTFFAGTGIATMGFMWFRKAKRIAR